MRLRALYLMIAMLAAAHFSTAQIPATDDGYTASSSPSSNYGTGSQLNVIGPGVNSYVRFDLTALPSGLTGANVSKATLRLNINGVTAGGTFDVYLVTKSWTETALSFNNAPTLGTKVASAVPVTTSKRNFIDVDVTTAVQAWLTSPNPSPNYGVALVPSSGSSISVSFDSKENTSTSHDPELFVAMVSAGAQGPQGIQGIQGPPGPPGAQGQQGLMGFTGPQGQPGSQGAAGQGFNFKAAFDPAAAYAAYDVVSFNGSSYVAKAAANPGDPAPDTNPNWSLIAQQGATGQQGAKGDTGPQGPQGSTGPQGAQGIQGTQGPPGTSAGLNGIQEFTSTGTFTPPQGVTKVLFEAWGGGGGAGNGVIGSHQICGFAMSAGGGGGGAGGYVRAVVTVTPGNVYAVDVGAAGGFRSSGGDSDISDGTTVLAAARGGKAGGDATISLDSQDNVCLGSNGVGGNGGGFLGMTAIGRVGPDGTGGSPFGLGAFSSSGNGGLALQGTGSVDPIGGGGAGAGANNQFAQPGYALITY